MIVWGILLLGAIGSASGYYAVSVALAPEPPAESFDGWIAILQPAADIDAGMQVRVDAAALTHSSRPRMAYGATVCGRGSFSGYFLLGGDARLEDAMVDAGQQVAQQLLGGDLNVADQSDGSFVTYPGVQVIRVTIKDPPRCLGKTADETYAGSGFRIEGNAFGPVVASGDGLALDTAVERWSMPYVGGLPGTGQRIGVFSIDGAIRGDFVRPPAFAATVDAGAVPVGLDLSDARPPTDAVDRASWYLPQSFQATVKVRDSTYQTTLQRWSALCAIGLGVFGSIVASMLFESARSRTMPQDTEVVAQPIPATGLPKGEHTRAPNLSWGWPLAAVAGFLVGRHKRRARD